MFCPLEMFAFCHLRAIFCVPLPTTLLLYLLVSVLLVPYHIPCAFIFVDSLCHMRFSRFCWLTCKHSGKWRHYGYYPNKNIFIYSWYILSQFHYGVLWAAIRWQETTLHIIQPHWSTAINSGQGGYWASSLALRCTSWIEEQKLLSLSVEDRK